MASTYLTRTAGTSTSETTFTISAWCKINNSSFGTLFFATSANNNTGWLQIRSNGEKLDVSGYSTNWLQTSRLFRDVNSWYHIVIAIDSTQATASNRVKLYINGIEETSFAVDNRSSIVENQTFGWNVNSSVYNIGGEGNAGHFNGSMSHIHCIDGIAYDASAFGETDATTGEWEIKTSPSVTYGTNGFFILKDGNSVTDQSGRGNNFSINVGAGGGLNKTEDCPSNVFATLNPLGPNTDATFSYGNTKVTYGTASNRSMVSTTLGAFNGRYYWEMKLAGSVSPNNITAGVGTKYAYDAGPYAVGSFNETWGIQPWNGQVHNNGSSVGGTWATFASGDIMQIAINLVDEQGGLNKLYFGKNGSWLNGADPSNYSSATGVVGITKPENGSSGFVFPLFADGGTSATPAPELNFGNGYFANNPVSSAGTNASGNGIFEYDVPTGFTALSTKGLNL